MATPMAMRFLSDQQTYLFTDFRHIDPGDLKWLGSDGEPLRLKPGLEPSPSAAAEPQPTAFARPVRQPHGIRLEAQQAQKIGPLDPGIGSYTLGINALLHEGGRYRLWYWHGKHGHYAESDDGFSWHFPTFGRYEIDGSTQNNAFFGVPPERGRRNLDGFTVFVDASAPASERYKMVFMAHVPEDEFERRWAEYRALHHRYQDVRLRPGKFTCVYGGVSPDGLDWTLLPEPLFTHFTDTITTAYYDEWLQRYVLYTRMYLQGRRWVGRTETADFHHWPPVEPLLWPRIDESPSNDIYTNGRTAYPGEPSIHLMFPMFYERWNQISRIRLYSSPDGIVWNEAPGEPVISPGTPSQWDSDFLVAGTGLVPLADERVGLLYSGTSYPHKYPRWPHVREAVSTGWACWPRGRLCAVVADEQGEFFTFPVQPQGRELRVNFQATRGGGLWVGVEGRSGRALTDCDPLFGDSLGQTVRWHGESDIGTEEEAPVVLHFKLRAAKLFGFEWS
ncbi:MAG: hypothetical protein CL878_07025 [Dehalococcoidia bacterium]|nr:hypothetical protein [Dehalococcoidia bacterium]